MSILIPIISYLWYCSGIIKKKLYYKYTPPATKSLLIQSLFRFLSGWINSPMAVLTIFTFLFFAFWDTGFSVLFLFFLICKSILLNFSWPVSKKGQKEASEHRIYAWIALAALIWILADKHAIALLISSKNILISGGLFLSIPAAWILFRRNGIRNLSARILPIAIFGIYMIPVIRNKTEGLIDDKIRHVVYRTSILFQPVEKMLFGFEYNSGKERKIIETAQNQWFINSYLNKEKTSFIQSKKINFRPHFRTGVDYLTQTRDVVLPRYVIAEFGGLSMFLLLLCLTVPLLFYFLVYRMTENGHYHASSYTGALVLILLFVTGLFVWLCSTNRFVFFGQDFPFLSLTSRTSTILPMLLMAFLLIQSPLQRSRPGENKAPNWWGALALITLLAGTIWFTKKSSLLDEKNFTVNFGAIENRIDEINNIFDKVQQQNKATVNALTEDNLKLYPDRFAAGMKDLLDQLYRDREFKLLYDSISVYEKSILDKLNSDPRTGFRMGNPVHLKYDDERFRLNYNKYFQLELPAYNIREVWKGDIVQQSLTAETNAENPSRNLRGSGQAEMIIIPGNYLSPGTGKRGLLNHTTIGGSHLQSYIYNSNTRLITQLTRNDFVKVIDSSDIIFLKNPAGNYEGSMTLYEYERPYFAYSFRINGKQRQIYPMGNRFFWIRHFSESLRSYYEKNGELEHDFSLSLDYKLTNTVSSFLQKTLRQYKDRLPELSFSAISADGNGQIRLMADFDMKRTILDPNDERSISQKKKEEYFFVSDEAERRQWGNLNLLRLKQGPGSSIKPLVAAAATSQLNLGWENLEYRQYPELQTDSKGKLVIENYAGLDLGKNGWKIEGYQNNPANLRNYISQSSNLYHSLVMFLGSYTKEQFGIRDHSFKNILTTNPGPSGKFPLIGINGEKGNFFLPAIEKWPGTFLTLPENTKPTYFGNTQSLLAQGLQNNFGLLVEEINKFGLTNQKSNFAVSLPDSLAGKSTWSFPEESYFLQSARTAINQRENFIMGLQNPTLGGTPYQVSPFKMMEMYGRYASLNNRFRASIDKTITDSLAHWNFDPATWNTLDNYKQLLENQLSGGMADVLTNGTGKLLNQKSDRYKGYYLYAKTGTIDGDTKQDNSKRFALIISKEPLHTQNGQTPKFYIVFFSIGNAYREMAGDKQWFWEFYKKILDQITESESFKTYMK